MDGKKEENDMAIQLRVLIAKTETKQRGSEAEQICVNVHAFQWPDDWQWTVVSQFEVGG